MSIGQLLSISVNVRGSTGELKWEKSFLNLRSLKFILIATSDLGPLKVGLYQAADRAGVSPSALARKAIAALLSSTTNASEVEVSQPGLPSTAETVAWVRYRRNVPTSDVAPGSGGAGVL